MDEQEAKNRIDILRAEIARHEALYRLHNAPEIPDDDFDLLMKELRALEGEFPQFYDANSPTVKVGSDSAEGFESVEHVSPMLSLDNVFNTAELAEFDARLRKVLGVDGELEYCIEPKIDGAGISAVYENGKLVRLLTRGDGEKGDDITRNARVIKNLPQRLSPSNAPSFLEIRGEAYMEVGEFERVKNAQREELIKKETAKKKKANPGESPELSADELAAIEKKLPANPRNLAAGTMKLLDAEILSRRALKAVFYSIGKMEGAKIERQCKLPSALQAWGLPAVNWRELAKGPEGAFEKICSLEEIRAEFPFNTDGAVVKLDDCSLHEAAGMTSHAPRWAVAWKYRAERAQTRLNSISIQVGRTGAVTPVAELEPIANLSGTEVKRATLHNEGYIAQKDIRVGDTVIVEKAGEIIPAVIAVVPELRPADSMPFAFPTICPECGSALKKFGEKMLSRCPNIACPPQVRGRLEHFASRDCMDIRGLGEVVTGHFVDDLRIHDPSDLYSITREQLLSLGKFKDKSSDNMIAAIEASKSRELWRLIFGLGILEIGEQFAKDLAAKFGTLDALMNADIEDIKSIDGFGSKTPKKKKDGGEPSPQPVRALSVRAFFDNPQNREMIEKLRKAGLNFKTLKTAGAQTAFAGKTFVLTGSLKSMGRDKAKETIERLGGRTANSVSTATNFLVSDGEISGAKIQKAKELGTKIVLEDEFLEMIAEAEEMPAPKPEVAKKPAVGNDSGQLSLF